MANLFKIEDFTKDGNTIVLFCCKNNKDFEIKFTIEKFIDWLHESDRLLTQGNVMEGTEHVGYFDSSMSEDEYWGLPDAEVKKDLYEYVLLRLVAPHELFNGTEKALLTLLTNAA